jgi:sugar lactone lactonase YvrE
MGGEGTSKAGARVARDRHVLGGRAHRALGLFALALLAWLGALVISQPTALAATGHKFLSQLSEAPPGTPLTEPEGVAVDQAGDVFVADPGAGVVDVFEPSGKFKTQLGAGILEGELPGLAVDSSGKVYVADTGTSTLDVFKPNGGGYELLSQWSGEHTPAEAFLEPAGVAIDNSTSKSDPSAGDVYVLDRGEAVVYVFKPIEEAAEGKFVAAKKLLGPNAIAVDSSTGKLYVGDNEKKEVFVYSATHKLEGKIKGTGTPTGSFAVITGVGVEEATHDVYVVDGEARVVDQFNSTGTAIGALQGPGAARFGEPRGVALAAAGDVYISDLPAAVVDHFGPNIIVPDVTTSAASEVKRTAATLNGSLTPQGKAKYHFEYGETEAYGSNTPVAEAEGTTPISVHAVASGLKPDTTYDFRLAAENENGPNFGIKFEFHTPPAVTGVTTGAASNVEPTTATLSGSLQPESLKTTYRFDYGETTSYGKESTTQETAAGGTVAASAKVEGLTPNTIYHFRLSATNEFGTTNGGDASFKTAGPPVIVEPTVTESLGATSEQVTGTINPGERATKYHVEYGESISYGTNSSPEGEIPAGEAPAPAPATLSGLSADTIYHFRFIASNGAGTVQGPDHQFRTPTTAGGSASLPDGRAYEMVSPPDKKAAFIEGINRIGGVVQASEDGSAVAYVVDGAIVENPDGNRSPEAQQVISTRSSGGWPSQEIVAPHERAFGIRVGTPPEYVLFSSDLSLSLLQPFPFGLTALAEPPLSPPLSVAERGHQEKTIYLREDAPIPPGGPEAAIYNQAKQNGETLASEHGEAEAKPGYLPLVTALNVAPGTQFGGSAENGSTQKVAPNIIVLQATPDLSHVVLVSNKALAPQGPSAPGLYEWGEGKLQLVSVLPDGKAFEGVEAELGFGPAQINHQVGINFRHAISDDGSHVVWTSAESGQGGLQGLGHLYLRDTSKGETVQLDEPAEGGPIAEPGKAQFQTASSDGSKVFFTDTQRLTKDSGAEPEIGSQGVPPRPDLYECEMVVKGGKLACELSDLTPKPASGESAAVQGLVLGASEDGSYVYFVANGVLAPGATQGACTTKPGVLPPGTTCNLYVLHRSGTEWTTSLIARLSSEDAPDWFDPNLGQNLLINLTARVAPQGHYVAFMSNRRLTGYDNTDVNEAEGKHADEEVFLYDASRARVTCASCNPTGARPNGVLDQRFAGEGEGLAVDRPQTWVTQANEGVDHWLAGNIPGWTPLFISGAIYQSRYLSDSGRLFFNSADPLVPEAAGHTRNETIGEKEGKPLVASVGVENVYQFEPNGVGSCTNASGCVALISSGTSSRESAFMDASANGNDAFFLTASPLLPQDQDASFDVYDARVCTEASPCLPPQPPPGEPCGSAATCKGGSTAPPTFQPPPSSDVSTPGNPVPSPPKVVTLPTTVRKLTTAQKLARALKVCRKLPHKSKAQKKKRAACEAQARRKYRVKTAKKTRHSHGRGR